MKTLVGDYEILYGWYYHPKTRTYQFWWVNQNLVCVEESMLDLMPAYLATEIRASAMVKPTLDS